MVSAAVLDSGVAADQVAGTDSPPTDDDWAMLTSTGAPPTVAAPARSKAVAARALSAGAVASPDRYGALAAREILEAGGNAVDAAVATGFALAVTYPEAGNLGGGGFMTLYVGGKPYFLDYRETAPAAASADMYLGKDGEPIADLSLFGNLAVATPGRFSPVT